MSKMAKVHVHRWKVDHQQPPLPPVWYCRIYLNEGNLSCIGPIRISRCRRSRCLETPASPAKGTLCFPLSDLSIFSPICHVVTFFVSAHLSLHVCCTYEYFLQSLLSVYLFLMSSYVCIFPVKRQQLKNDHIRHPCLEQNLYQNNKTKITIPPPMNQPPNKNHNHQLTSARYDPKELINFLDSKKWRRQRSLVQKGRKYAQAVSS